VTDLGEFPPDAAGEYFLGLAERAHGDVGVEAISAASFADEVMAWPRLLALARNRDRTAEVRKKALFWVSQAAGESISDSLDGVTWDDEEDLEVRKAAVFALSQRPRDEGLRALLRVARGNIHPEVRRSAFFWLAQYDDPEVARFFEDMLLGK
jgi:HEAT repeat protein